MFEKFTILYVYSIPSFKGSWYGNKKEEVQEGAKRSQEVSDAAI